MHRDLHSAEKYNIAMIRVRQNKPHIRFYSKHRIFVRSFDKIIDRNFMPDEQYIYMYIYANKKVSDSLY
uniref:Uncharacterized protein n=1 Tax=Arundo donax TaxID=35708 RepID=A0A0A9HMB9_ARUDO